MNLEHVKRRAEAESKRLAWGDMTLSQQALIPAYDRPHLFSEDRVHYIDTDVLTAARERIKHCLSTFDTWAVSYSGGKDSHVVMHLVRGVMDDMGLKQPLNVIFRDEELIPDDVINHVISLRDEPDRYTLHYFAVPMSNQFFVMGKHMPYIQWDESREWVRPKPDFAITQLHPENQPLLQQDMGSLTNERLGFKGKVCIFNGIRAQESMLRFRSCVAIKNAHNYIVQDAGGSKSTKFVKPIYDWGTRDIFRYFYDYEIGYCKIYDAEMLAGTPDGGLRVSTPLHDQAYGYLCRLRVMYPTFFEQLCAIFPGVATHERYWRAVDRYGVIDNYPKSFAGIFQYIDDTVDDLSNNARAKRIVATCRTARENNKMLGKFAGEGNCYGFPLLHIFKKIVGGDYIKGIQSHSNPDAAMIEYENQANGVG